MNPFAKLAIKIFVVLALTTVTTILVWSIILKETELGKRIEAEKALSAKLNGTTQRIRHDGFGIAYIYTDPITGKRFLINQQGGQPTEITK